MIVRHWTEHEVQLLKDNPTLPDAILAEKLGRPIKGVQAKRSQLGIIKEGRWTPEEIQMVRDNPGLLLKDLAKLIGRSLSSCHRYRQIADREAGFYAAGDAKYRAILAKTALHLARGDKAVAERLFKEILSPSGDQKTLGAFRNANLP